jgi:hypothetical protein
MVRLMGPRLITSVPAEVILRILRAARQLGGATACREIDRAGWRARGRLDERQRRGPRARRAIKPRRPPRNELLLEELGDVDPQAEGDPCKRRDGRIRVTRLDGLEVLRINLRCCGELLLRQASLGSKAPDLLPESLNRSGDLRIRADGGARFRPVPRTDPWHDDRLSCPQGLPLPYPVRS